MVDSVPHEQATSIIITTCQVAWLGIVFAAIGNAYFKTEKKLAPWFNFEPMSPEEPALVFDRIFEIIFNPLGAKVGAFTKSPRTTRFALQASFAFVMIISAIAVEIAGLFTVTGVALAQYHLVGETFDLTTAYQTVIAFVVLLTLVFTNYGTRKIKEKTKYC